ncbi:patatin-like phospholipase domain-containing protein [Coprinopsis sp. MPI-PUGE-AT-0042]|nr:patatin-like phospholipase domain-containing protein [Coprinopsis sp. MPI-PUGE-AT-0042]
MSPNIKGKPSLEELLQKDYVNEEHIAAFARALQDDESYFDDAIQANSPNGTSTPRSTQSVRIRKVSALSDFAPVNLRVRRTKSRKVKHSGGRHDLLFLLLRWPLLIFIFTVIMGEFGLYVLIRQVVNAKEWITAWRGQKGRLRKKLRASQTYEEWKEAATALDHYLHFDEWKKVDEDPYYDWKLVRKVKQSLQTLREKGDARGCLGVLETCIRNNFAAVESQRLYSETYLGSKDLIESYFAELERSIEFVRKTPNLSIDEKRKFFKNANANLGTSALCLSGGASFGYYHFGVVKAFFEAGLLPRVISGTSAGGLIAAFACCYTDEELRIMLVPEIADRITACEESIDVWVKRFLKTGARFDSVAWAKKCSFFTHGSLTFKEAYLRTGRILNISVIPADRHSPTKLLNYITAPDTVIWSTLLASAAVPGILNPVVIMKKLKDGTIVPWNWGSRFKDGSLRVDIPLQSLNLYFNVTNPVVSQVNPHVHLFFFAPRGSAGKPVAHRKGKGWRGNFLLSATEQWLKHELTKNFKVIRDLELLPTLLGQDWSSVFLQRFDGTITIWPRTRFADWIRILSDPDRPELQRMLSRGQIATWPKLHMIENRARIERQIFAGRQEVRRTLKSKVNLKNPNNPNLLSVPGASGQEARSTNRSRSPATSKERIPLSVDTDAERAFTQGASWFYRRGRRSRPESPTAGDDPLRSPALRRKWTSDLLSVPNSGSESGPEDNEDAIAQGEKPRTISQSTSLPSPSIFARFRTNSFIQGFKSRLSPDDDAPHDGLNLDSEESSSEDDDDDWSPEHYRLHDSPALERRALVEDIGVDS